MMAGVQPSCTTRPTTPCPESKAAEAVLAASESALPPAKLCRQAWERSSAKATPTSGAELERHMNSLRGKVSKHCVCVCVCLGLGRKGGL